MGEFMNFNRAVLVRSDCVFLYDGELDFVKELLMKLEGLKILNNFKNTRWKFMCISVDFAVSI